LKSFFLRYFAVDKKTESILFFVVDVANPIFILCLLQ